MSGFVVEDRNGVRRVPVDRRMTIGRSPNNDLMLNAMFASRRHAWVWQQGDRFIIEDLTSTNGTFVNGRRLVHPQFLNHNDIITIGDGQLTFVAGWDLATDQTPPRGVPHPMASQVFCATCGASNPPQARFCAHCGGSLDVGVMSGTDRGHRLGSGPPSGYAQGAPQERMRVNGPFTPTDPVVARPFPVSGVSSKGRKGSGAWILILLLAILAVAFLTIMAVLVFYTLG
jgi:hypothetical protein